MKYEISYLEVVVKKHIPALSTSMKILVKTAIEERLSMEPIALGKPLRYTLKGYRRLRVGNYRIVYRINTNACSIIIVAIMNRRDIYEF